MRFLLCLGLVAFLFAGSARGQSLPPLHPPPTQGFSPLLYVRFDGPAGLIVTLYQGQAAGRDLKVPVKVGLRPGYSYRIRVTGFPNWPHDNIFPSLEVRGTLSLPPQLRAADYPAPIVFGPEDLRKARGGVVVTEVLTLENPDQAVPIAISRNEALESETEAGGDALEAARTRGRPLLILRMGARDFSADTLAGLSVSGTALLPGDRSLGPPAAPPWIPWVCVPIYDPISGARQATEECLHDGGDGGRPAAISPDGRLTGLDPADTVAEYSDAKGRRRKVAVSNRVCLCVPRFLVIRSETGLAGLSSRMSLGASAGVKGQKILKSRQPSEDTRQYEALAGVRGHNRLSGADNVQVVGRLDRLEVLGAHHVETGLGGLLGTKQAQKLSEQERVLLKRQVELALQGSEPYRLGGVDQILRGPTALGRYRGLNVIGSVQGTRDLTVTCNEAPVLPPSDKPLILHKWADRQSAQAGDVVTFFLKYSNHGGGEITDVAVSDSLTGRLEYIAGSAKADRDAVFTIQQNEAGSAILRWEINGPLQAGQSGVVSFQARVR